MEQEGNARQYPRETVAMPERGRSSATNGARLVSEADDEQD